MKDLEERINKIEKRNKRVELDKKWETSYTRRALIGLLTYIIVLIYSFSISRISSVFFTSLIPVIGFGLSTLSLKLCRRIWEKYQK